MKTYEHKQNFHGHTYLCHHAEGIPLDHVKKAIEFGYTQVGVSEHGPMLMIPNQHYQLKMEAYDLYLKQLDEAQALAHKHQIKFYKGFEIEFFPHQKIYERYLKDLDYLILGQHYIIRDGELKSSFHLEDIEDIKLYTDLVIQAMASGYFNMVAHPDLCFNHIPYPTDAMYEAVRPMIEKAKTLDIVLEFNANGLRKARNNGTYAEGLFPYPKLKFFEMVKAIGAKVMISSDHHAPELFHDWAIDVSIQICKHLELHLVNDLKMNYFKAR